MKRRTLALVGVLVSLATLFLYASLRSGPLAPVLVTVATVENQAIAPALFGIGTVEARYTYKIGPTIAGRVKRVDVQVSDTVKAGQVLGEMDPVDLDDRVNAQKAARQRSASTVLAAEAQVRDSTARLNHANTQAQRYQKLLPTHAISEEAVDAKQQEQQVAEAGLAASRANLDAARQELTRNSADQQAVMQQRSNLHLVAPVEGLVVARDADPGTTVVAGEAVVIIIDPNSLWIHARFDQLGAAGLRPGLPATILLRSHAGYTIAGQVQRVEPLADAVTEETLAKIVFDILPEPLPLVGELVEVTVALSALPATPVVSNASVQRIDGRLGVWLIEDGELRFAPIKMGAADLNGQVQILDGLKGGEHVVVYSQRMLTAHSRIKIVGRLPGVKP